MVYVLSFLTDKFDLLSERENSINPIKGISVGEWLNSLLQKSGVSVSSIEEEDWGWYSYATLNQQKYLIGYVALPETGSQNDAEIIIQINKERSLWQKLMGKNKLSPEDPLIQLVSEIIRGVDEFNEIKEDY